MRPQAVGDYYVSGYRGLRILILLPGDCRAPTRVAIKKKIIVLDEYTSRMGGRCVPQIWMTYDEIAELLHCDWTEARDYAAAALDRRRSRDGHTRAKLDPFLKNIFFDAVLRDRLERQTNDSVRDLKAMHERMQEPSIGAAPEPRAVRNR